MVTPTEDESRITDDHGRKTAHEAQEASYAAEM